MAEEEQKPDERPIRVQFEHGAAASNIAKAIQKIQDDWALKFPERAHRLYPQVYNADGSRVNPHKVDQT